MINDEKLFKEMAAKYVEIYGEELIKQAESLEEYESFDLRFLRRGRFYTIAAGILAAAACAIFLLLNVTLFSVREIPPSEDESQIPIDFILPRNLSITETKQDKGKSIYYLSDEGADDVVLIVERYSEAPSQYAESLNKLKIGGKDVYAYNGKDYKLLTFDKDGILYTMTCRYDVNTLVDLGDAIVYS